MSGMSFSSSPAAVDYMYLVVRFKDFQLKASPLVEAGVFCLETYAILSEVPGVDLAYLYSRLCDLSAHGQALKVSLEQVYHETLAMQLEHSEEYFIRQLLESRLDRIRKRFKLIDDIEAYRVCIGRIGGIVMQ